MVTQNVMLLKWARLLAVVSVALCLIPAGAVRGFGGAVDGADRNLVMVWCVSHRRLALPWRPEVLETVRDASKAATEIVGGCEFCFDRLPRAVGSS